MNVIISTNLTLQDKVMRKFLFFLMCLSLSVTASAQLQMVAFKSATATSYQSGEDASKAIDGNYGTIWHSSYSSTSFPVTITLTLNEKTHVDIIRYVPRQSGTNGNWNEVDVEYSESTFLNKWTSLGTYFLNGSGSSYDFNMPEGDLSIARVRFKIKSGSGNFVSAAEIEAYTIDNTKQEAFKPYFQDELFTVLKPEVTSSEGIEDADVKALVDNLLADKEGYSKFRVGEYEAYRTVWSLQSELKTKAPYNQWENPTGIYLKQGESCWVAVSGIKDDKVGVKIRNWVKDEKGCSFSLRNGLNQITATSEGNVFVDYYTDNFENAPNVNVHFINAPVRGYWDQETMTNADWVAMLKPLKSDSSIIIVRSEHAQLAYPVCAWKQHCPTNVDSLMTLYQQVQWAERDILGLKKYGREAKNRQLYFASTYGFMAATGVGAYCNVGSLGAIMTPDSKKFDFWGVGHEWGHNNQIEPGFHWSGCGETTNNIYASWAQIHFTGTPSRLRLEDENSGIDEYSNMRGGRMQTYFEEALRKGVQWQLQDGPDYYGATPETKTVAGYDYDGNPTGQVTTTSRNYDHFVKLVPFWQLNLWGTLAGKCPDIIPMVIEGIRTTENYGSTYNTNGKQQVNWMKLACDSAKLDLLPFFEKAGMLKPINAYIEDYGAGWNKINEAMINTLRTHVASKRYPAFTEEINYINAHNMHIYRDNQKLQVPATLGAGCTYSNGMVKVMHNQVKNAVAFETYNSKDSLIRITMYGLGADDAHSYTYVLYPASSEESDAADYIMAVGYDGTREKIYQKTNLKKGLATNKFYTISSVGKGNALSCGASTSINQSGVITWNLARTSAASINLIWYLEKRDGKTYLYNPQSNSYFTGTNNTKTTSLCDKASAPSWEISCVNENNNTYIFNMSGTGQYINSYDATGTGLWSGGSSDANNIWTVEEIKTIDFTIPSSGYYLGCCPFAIELPEGLEAYVVGETTKATYEGEEFTYAVMDKVDGNVVPARMPVILKAAPGKYTVSLIAEDNTPLTTPNLLKGTTLKQTGLTKATVMSTISASSEAGTTGTMKVNLTATTVPANRAYLLNTDINEATQVYLQTRDILTGIQEIDGTQSDENGVYYELNGTRAKKPQSGHVYITSNGKRILVK